MPLTVGDIIVFHAPELRAKFGDTLTVTRMQGQWFWCGAESQWGFTLRTLNEYIATGQAALACVPHLAPVHPERQ